MPVNNISNAKSLAATLEQSFCALINDGSIKCWGQGTSGQLGNGFSVDSDTPVVVSGITNAVKIVAGLDHFCALLSNAQIKCWGDVGNIVAWDVTGLQTRNTPIDFDISEFISFEYIDVAASNNATCVIISDGRPKCLGGGFEPTDFIDATKIVGISSGLIGWPVYYNMFFAMLSDGSVKAIGENTWGSLGTGANSGVEATPVSTVNIDSIYNLSIGGATGLCEVKSDSTISCWGRNVYQADTSAAIDTPTPLNNVGGITNAIQIATTGAWVIFSEYSYCALLSDNSVECWGDNNNGQLGDGDSPNDKLVPTPVVGIP